MKFHIQGTLSTHLLMHHLFQIVMYLVLTNKFSDTYWKLATWIIYIILVATSVWFTWGVLDKFSKQETAIQQYEDKIEALVHPTIAICNFDPSWEYQKVFNITYTIIQKDGLSVEIVLKLGKNDLKISEGIVSLSIIYTKYNHICYAINTPRNVDKRETVIKLCSPDDVLSNLAVFFTSEKNSYGITRRDWRDGEVYSFYISSRTRKDVTLTVEKNIKLKCSEESFYEYVASKLVSEESFEICNDTCLMTSLPKGPYPICPNYNEWYSNFNHAEKESDCNWSIVRDLIQNITNNDEHLKTCITTKYSGISHESSGEIGEIKYKFALPLKAKVYEEYFIIDLIGLIGSVGGTLGLFIGFSVSNLIICIIEYIQYLIEMKLRSGKKFTKTIWKCLEWIIYLFLITTAIFFAREVIEKFFGQSTGIKQNIEKIESHPTVTICPFQEQCDRPMKLIFRLHNSKEKEIQYLVPYLGSYNILSPDLVNGKPYWIHKHDANNALWYNSTYEAWIFGPVVYIGGFGLIIGLHGTLPYEVQTWLYFNHDYKLIDITTDVVVELGQPSLCMNDSHNYGTEFNFIYQTFESEGLTADEKIPLKMGENHLSLAKEIVSLSKIYTRWKSICYTINTTRKADFRKTEIKLSTSGSKNLEFTEIFFTSEENSYGVTNNKFMDGKAFSTQLIGGELKEIDLSIEKNMNLACSKESFFEYVASRLSDRNFENCLHTCLRTSLPNTPYSICPNQEDWYDKKGNLTELEDDCNWGIVRNLIEDIITVDNHLKTCITIGYSGKIMTENNFQASNELGVQYKFAFPLTTKVYQEYLITDTIDLMGSVGGMLSLFVGFSFTNIITYIMGYIGTFLESRHKLSKAFWTSIGWTLYLSLVVNSIWFAQGVLDKFLKQDTGIQKHEGKIEKHPTIVICMGSSKYETDFYISYSDEWLMGGITDLRIGENYLETLKETVYLTTVYTRYNGLCYSINTTQKVDERGIFISIIPSSPDDNLPEKVPVIFTSGMNYHGVTQRDWRDGEVFSFITSAGNVKNLDLSVKKDVNLKCTNASFYEYVASRLSEESFKKCNNTCLMTSLPNAPYPICPNYEEWYSKDTKERESDCNWHILRDLTKNITINEEHLKTCVTTQYLGKITVDARRQSKLAIIGYKFTLPLKAKVYEEYLIADGITLFGSLGGTMGLFISFSISNFVYTIMNFLKSALENHFSRK